MNRHCEDGGEAANEALTPQASGLNRIPLNVPSTGRDASRSSGGRPLGHLAPSGWLGEAISKLSCPKSLIGHPELMDSRLKHAGMT